MHQKVVRAWKERWGMDDEAHIEALFHWAADLIAERLREDEKKPRDQYVTDVDAVRKELERRVSDAETQLDLERRMPLADVERVKQLERDLRRYKEEYRKLYRCVVSYSDKDVELVERVIADISEQGVGCWFGPRHLRAGEMFRAAIHKAIERCGRLLVFVTESSMHSQWVEEEVEIALEIERLKRISVVVPVRLDDAILGASAGWPLSVRARRHVFDLSNLDDGTIYREALSRLAAELRD